MFAITENAAEQILKQIENENAQKLGLRFAATFSEDRTIQYIMGFDEIKGSDRPHTISGIKVLMDDETTTLMDEARLDFVELEPGDFQFIFINPLDPSYVPPEADKAT